MYFNNFKPDISVHTNTAENSSFAQSPHAEQTAVPVEDVMRHSREEPRETGLLVISITNSHNFKLDSMRTQRNYVRPFLDGNNFY